MFFFFIFSFFLFQPLLANIAGLFAICLNKIEINAVVVNKSVYVDFPSIVMSKFARLGTIRVPFF